MRITLIILMLSAAFPGPSHAQSERSQAFVQSLGRSYSSALAAFRSGQPVPGLRLPEDPALQRDYSWFSDNVARMQSVQAGRDDSESVEIFRDRIRQVAQVVNMDPQAAIRLYGLRVKDRARGGPDSALADRHLRGSRLGREQAALPDKLAQARGAFAAQKDPGSMAAAGVAAAASAPRISRAADFQDLPPRVQPLHARFIAVPPVSPTPEKAAANRNADSFWKPLRDKIMSWSSAAKSDPEPPAPRTPAAPARPQPPPKLEPLPALPALAPLPGEDASRARRPKKIKDWATLSGLIDWDRAARLAESAKKNATVGFTGKCYRYVKKTLRALFPWLQIWGESAGRFAKDNPQVLKQLNLYKVNPALLPDGMPPMGALISYSANVCGFDPQYGHIEIVVNEPDSKLLCSDGCMPLTRQRMDCIKRLGATKKVNIYLPLK